MRLISLTIVFSLRPEVQRNAWENMIGASSRNWSRMRPQCIQGDGEVEQRLISINNVSSSILYSQGWILYYPERAGGFIKRRHFRRDRIWCLVIWCLVIWRLACPLLIMFNTERLNYKITITFNFGWLRIMFNIASFFKLIELHSQFISYLLLVINQEKKVNFGGFFLQK